MNKKLFYYGTNLTSAGHGFYELNEKGFNSLRYDELPFCAETLADKKNLRNGDIEYFRIPIKNTDCVVIHIEGSCSDERSGSKSVFWVYGKITDVKLGDLKEIILSNPTAKSIIDKMPFEVNW